GADFVFSAIRVGGLAARVADERVAREAGVLGQETTGAGGLAYAVRTVPAALRIAERVAATAPNAFVINFTNPAGIVTEVMRTVLGDRVVGICDTPVALIRRLTGLLGVPAFADYAGINHLGWLRRLVHDGVDRLPGLLAGDALAGTEEDAIFGLPWLRTLGVIPNEYLYYYYFTREAVRSGAARGEYLLGQQDDFYRAAAADPARSLDLWTAAVRQRSATYFADARGGAATPEGAGYEGVALAVLAAVARNEPAELVLDVANQGTLPGLPDDMVVEVPCAVDGGGARPLPVSPLAQAQSGLVQQVRAAERLAARAAVTGSRRSLLAALAQHPLVDSVTVAGDLLAGCLARIPEVAAVLTEP
ncbi:MAG TPA: 6-phospho-beta-glucosidase, partial [Pseudonocardiaceae bacterium]|nr:6-phospho-beta-glucosidase [Pseudonocardiaceae bacterium]